MAAPVVTYNAASKEAAQSQRKPVRVNGVAIARKAIATEAQHHPSESASEAWQSAARALVVRELLLQEARRLAVLAEPMSDGEGRRETDEEAKIRTLVEREVSTPVADEAACRRYYDNNRQRFRSPDLYEVRHILLAATSPNPPGDSGLTAAAEVLIEQLSRDPGSFATLAAQYSACPSREHGGNLGQIGPGQTVPEFETALAKAPVGRVHGEPVETRYGLHVVLVERRIDGVELPFDMVHDRIADWLGERARNLAIRHYITVLARRADIEGVSLQAEMEENVH